MRSKPPVVHRIPLGVQCVTHCWPTMIRIVVGQWGVVRMDVDELELEMVLPLTQPCTEYAAGSGHGDCKID